MPLSMPSNMQTPWARSTFVGNDCSHLQAEEAAHRTISVPSAMKAAGRRPHHVPRQHRSVPGARPQRALTIQDTASCARTGAIGEGPAIIRA
jgi:hypothetical protein